MWIGGEAADVGKFLAKVMKLGRVDAPFDIGARVDAGRSMALKIDHVRIVIAVASAKKMVEADFVESRGRRIGRNMAADIGMKPIGFDHHGHGVPAHIALDAPLDFAIAGIVRLFLWRDRIDVGRADPVGNFEPGFAQTDRQARPGGDRLVPILRSLEYIRECIPEKRPICVDRS